MAPLIFHEVRWLHVDRQVAVRNGTHGVAIEYEDAIGKKVQRLTAHWYGRYGNVCLYEGRRRRVWPNGLSTDDSTGASVVFAVTHVAPRPDVGDPPTLRDLFKRVVQCLVLIGGGSLDVIEDDGRSAQGVKLREPESRQSAE